MKLPPGWKTGCEREVKAEVKKILARLPYTWYYMPVQTGYGVSGVPDFIVCINGHFISIETKRLNVTELSPNQVRNQTALSKAKANYFIVNVFNVDGLYDQLVPFTTTPPAFHA